MKGHQSDARDPEVSAAAGRPRGAAGVDEALMWALLDATPDSLVVIDDAGIIQLVNAQSERVFGYAGSEMVGQPVEILIPAAQRDTHRDHRTRYQTNPRPRPMGSGLPLFGQRADGSRFPVEISLSPVDDGAAHLTIASVRDVTNRLQAERYTSAIRHAIELAVDGILIADDETLELTYVNQRTAEILGYTVDEMIGMTPLDLAADLTAADVKEALAPVLAGERESLTVQTDLRRKDGSLVPVGMHINHPPGSTSGADRPIVAMLRDITDRLVAESELRASEGAFRAAFDAAPVGMAMATVTSTGQWPLTNVNQSLCDMLGYTREELITRTIADITHPDDRKADEVALDDMLADSRDSYVTEKRYITADGGELWAWLHSTPLVDRDGVRRSVLAHIVDLSERRAVELKREHDRQRVEGLAAVRAAALNEVEVPDILQLVCFHSRRLVGADTSFVATVDVEAGVATPIVYDRDESRSLVPESLSIDGPIRAAMAGETFVSGGLLDDKRIDVTNRDRTEERDHVVSGMVVPIGPVDKVSSLLFLGSREPSAFSTEDVEVVLSFADEAATALQLSEARAQQSRIRVLEDRERLARDLHDVVIQQLFGAGMGLQAVQQLATDPVLSDRIRDTVVQLDQTIAELRSAIFNLSVHEALMVQDQIGAVIGRAATRLGFEPILSFEGDPESIPGVILEQLLPTLTEALSNAARHADATRVDVTITVADFVRLVVSDNGVGIDPDGQRGNGLNNIESRAKRLRGTAAVESSPEGGTTLIWTAVGVG